MRNLLVALRSRGRLQAVVSAVVVVLGSVLVAAAPPASASSSQSGAASVSPYEWNIAKSTRTIGGRVCPTFVVGSRPRAIACFKRDGDKLYVMDTGPADGLSATGVWKNYVGGKLHRQGACVNKLGTGHWGLCDKNFKEGSTIRLYACNYNSGNNTWHGCSKSLKFKA